MRQRTIEDRTTTDSRLEAFLIRGLASGDDTPLTPEFWSELGRDAVEILASQKQPGKTRQQYRSVLQSKFRKER
jgi:hypothetical protein